MTSRPGANMIDNSPNEMGKEAMEPTHSRFYRVVPLLLLLVLPSCVGIIDPMIAGSSVDDYGYFFDDARAIPPAPPCIQIGTPRSDLHREMFEQLNDYRARHGLEPLIYSVKLEETADLHVMDLWQRGFFAHINPDGQNPGDRALEAGFCHKYVGENLAAGQNTVDRAMQAWINSPSHNENMLEPDYVYVGMGYSVDGNGRAYWAQVLAFDVP